MKRAIGIVLATLALGLGSLSHPEAWSSSDTRPSKAASKRASQGRVVGSRRARVYYRAGQSRSLPPQRERVYFQTEAQARAAGYRAWQVHWKVPPSLPPTKPEKRSPASPLGRQQPGTAPTAPMPNQ